MDNTLRQVQLLQLDLVKKIHKICTENDIKYTIIGGTMLGAVRHKGFIPWDDDLDIALPRKDYDRLIEYLKKNPIDGCFLQNYETESHYVQPFSKLRLNNTKYLETFYKGIDMHQGIFIDIFPLDKIKEPTSREAKIRRVLSKQITFAIWRKEKCTVKRNGIKKLEFISSSVIGLLPKSALIKMQNSLVNRESKDWQYVASLFSSNYPPEKLCFRLTDFDSLILTDYEDTQLYTPSNYDEILHRLFKNYMALPPEDKRNSGHSVYKIEL